MIDLRVNMLTLYQLSYMYMYTSPMLGMVFCLFYQYVCSVTSHATIYCCVARDCTQLSNNMPFNLGSGIQGIIFTGIQLCTSDIKI